MARSIFLTSLSYLSILFCLSDSSRFTRNSLGLGSKTLGIKSGEQNTGNGAEKNLVRLPRDQYSSSYKVPKHYTIVDPGPGWNPRQLTSSFATTNLLPSQSAASDYPYAGSDEDNAVAAGGHGHSQSGWGWGQGQGYKDEQSQVNNSAVGMLGFLSLLALIQERL
ncbi:unnamed protein product [Orchesella dallaii]|uniref:Uncharacterized protein n=1 Tax=Orchesella dallaii TaxID=48710 RepID=A0ABP1QW63_9HEXA